MATTISGRLSGLDPVPVPVGKQTLSVRLDRAKVVEVTQAGQIERVACTLVVRQGEKEIFRQSESLGAADLLRLVEVGQLRGHSDVVQSVVASPDGRRLLSGSNASEDRTLILWDRDTGRLLRRFRQQGGPVLSVAISPDGRRALSGGLDTVVRLWDTESGDVVREIRGHTEWVFSVAFSPDGRLAYSTSGGRFVGGWQDGTDSAIRVWDVASGRQVRRLDGHRGIVWSVVVSPDGRRVLSGGQDRTSVVWDAETGAEIRRFRGHTDHVTCAAFLPDGLRRLMRRRSDDTALERGDRPGAPLLPRPPSRTHLGRRLAGRLLAAVVRPSRARVTALERRDPQAG